MFKTSALLQLGVLLLLIRLHNCELAESDPSTHPEKLKISKSEDEKQQNVNNFDRKSYQRLLQVKREQQNAAVMGLLDTPDSKRLKTVVKELVSQIQHELNAAKEVILKNNFLPKSSIFPMESGLREVVAKIVENTAFFFELTAYLPDYTVFWYKKIEHLKPLIEWAYVFSTKMALYDDETYKLFENAAQELELIPRASNYKNPYRKANIKEALQQQAYENYLKKQNEKKATEKKATKKKGPKLSKSEL